MRGLAIVGAALLALALSGSAPAEPAEAELRAAIADFVRARAPRPPSAVEVPALEDFTLAGEAHGAGPVEIALSANPKQRFVGRVPVTVALRSGGRELKRGVVTVGVRLERPVAVAARAVPRGAVLGLEDLRLEVRDAAALEGRSGLAWIRDPEAWVGRRARRSLRAGDPVASAWLERAPLVERGQSVRIELRRGGLRIETSGEARADGSAGDWIKVLNRDSRRELVGRVGADGAVHVSF